MTNLNKYRRQNHNLLSEVEAKEDSYHTKDNTKKPKNYVEKITINLTQKEAELLNITHKESGITKSEIIRRELKKTGFFQ